MSDENTATTADVVAALDIGSNSFHLIVARIIDGSIQNLHKIKHRVRLAQGLSDDGTLSQEAMDRGLETLSQMADTLKDIPADNIRVVATYTLRKAQNSQAFLTQAEAVFPYPIEIIPGKEEARLIYQGVAHTVAHEGNKLVIDIGGGSTEFIIGEYFTPLQLNSRSMGCVSYTNQFFKNGKITEHAFQRAILAAEQELEIIVNTYKNTGWHSCHGTSGTIKAIREAIVQNGWSKNEIKASHLEKLKQSLITYGHIDKINIPGVSEHRRPVLAGGLAVLIAAFDSLGIESMTYEDAALREGVLYEMQDRFKHHDIRERTIESLSQRYAIDTAQAARVARSACFIFDQLDTEWKFGKLDYRSLLHWSGLLHEIGLQIHSSGYHKHSAYIVENTDMPGFNQEEQIAIACLVRFHRKKCKLNELPKLSLYKSEPLTRLIRILRIAAILNLRRRENYLSGYTVRVKKDHIELQFPKDFLNTEKLLNADLENEQNIQAEAGFKLSIL